MNTIATIVGIAIGIICTFAVNLVFAQELPSNVIFEPDQQIIDVLSKYWNEPQELGWSPLSIGAKDIQIIDIPILQDDFYKHNGYYQQVKGLINVYESPNGWGYQVIDQLNDKIIYTGYGIDSQDYTYTIDIAIPSSSSSSTSAGN